MATTPQFGENPWSDHQPSPKPERMFTLGPGNVIRWVADDAPAYSATPIKIAEQACYGIVVLTGAEGTEVLHFVWAGVGATGAGEPCSTVLDETGGDANGLVLINGNVAGQKASAAILQTGDLAAAASAGDITIYQGASGDDSLYIANKVTPGAEGDEAVVSVYLFGINQDRIASGIET